MEENNRNNFLIVIVGNCCSGKTTLAHQLIEKEYNAKAILQEHAISKKMWRRSNPDILVYLSCNLETANNRRSFSWGQRKLDSQKELLSDAFMHADVKLETDNLSKKGVCQRIIDYLKKEGY